MSGLLLKSVVWVGGMVFHPQTRLLQVTFAGGRIEAVGAGQNEQRANQWKHPVAAHAARAILFP